ncbi:MAG: hypothetical protein R3C14_54355 [Caldilineaceae bacterium]
MNHDEFLAALRGDLTVWLGEVAKLRKDSPQAYYANGRVGALTDTIAAVTGKQAVEFGTCPHCKHLGYVSTDNPVCPGCNRSVDLEEWRV